MNYNIRLFTAAAALAAALTSCEIKTLEPWPDNPEPARTAALQVSGELAAWAGEDGWGGADIGLRAVSPLDGGLYASCRNVRYCADTTGLVLTGFTAADDGIQFGEDDASVTFTAYAPYEETATASELPGADGVISRSVLDQSGQASLDFLFAGGQSAGIDSPALTFTFFHRMSQLVFNIRCGGDLTSDEVAGGAYSLDGLVLDGAFDTGSGSASVTTSRSASASASGTASASSSRSASSSASGVGSVSASASGTASTSASGSAETLPLSGNCPSSEIGGAGISFTAISYPQSFTALTFTGTVGGVTLGVDLAAGSGVDTFAAGTTYTYDLEFTADALTLTGCAISDWESGDTWDGGVNPGGK